MTDKSTRTPIVQTVHHVWKKHPEHYRLSLKEMSTNCNNFRYKYFWHNWPINQRNMHQNEQKNVKKHPQHYRLWLEKDWYIIIIFGANIFDTTGHQTTVPVPTSPNVCVCTTWKSKQRICALKWTKTLINFIYLDLWPWTASQLHYLTVMQHCVNDFHKCWWIQKVTGDVWIGLKQNIIDVAVNETRNHLCSCGHVMSWH